MQPSVYKNYKFGNTQVKYLYQGSTLVWPEEKSPYEMEYFTIESGADNNEIRLTINQHVDSSVLSYVAYSTDKVNWIRTNVDDTEQIIRVILNDGDKLYWKGDGTRYSVGNPDEGIYSSKFSASKTYTIYGNIASLLYGDSFTRNNITLPGDCTFFELFDDSSTLTDAHNLILNFKSCTSSCYAGMFSRCTSLTAVPVLPATTLAHSCYAGMFSYCTSLTTAPVLHATTLAPFCYSGMFISCSNLTSVPILPATTLAEHCYEGMFGDCTSLTAARVLPATTLADNCYATMFIRCTSLTTAPVLPATTLAYSCYASMFQGCTSLTTAPVLPATTFAIRCYANMFDNCTNLNYIKCLGNAWASYSTYNWVANVSPTGMFVRTSSQQFIWPTGDSGIPSGWTVIEEP